jgi:hypothetical protein
MLAGLAVNGHGFASGVRELIEPGDGADGGTQGGEGRAVAGWYTNPCPVTDLKHQVPQPLFEPLEKAPP